MQEVKEYAGESAPVKSGPGRTGFGQRMECRITTRGGALRLSGTVAEVMGWLRDRCPGDASRAGCKMTELSRLVEVRG